MPREAGWGGGTGAGSLLRLLGDAAELDAAARAPLVRALALILAAPAHDVPALLASVSEALPAVEAAVVLAAAEAGWCCVAAAGCPCPDGPLPRDLLEHGALAAAWEDPEGSVIEADALPPGLLPAGIRAAFTVAPVRIGGVPACAVLLGVGGARVLGEAGAIVARVAAERITDAVEMGRLERRVAQAEEAARRTGGFRDQVLAIVGHDLRNPLGAVVMSAALLQKRGGLEGWQAKTVDRIRASAMRMGRIIDDLLSYTRTRLGDGIPVRRAPTDLGDVARKIVDEQRVAHPDAVVDLVVEGALSGEWDATRLEQVLSNLVSNAIDHGEDDRPVTVSVAGGDEEVTIAVENRGEMPPGILEHAFEAFRRGPEETGRKASGLGLGLFIAREIVRRHGGEIHVRSGDGRTRVTATLPRGERTGG